MEASPTLVGALWASIWADNTGFGRLVVLAILYITFVAWRHGRRCQRRFKFETRQLKLVKEQLRLQRQAIAGTDLPEDNKKARMAKGDSDDDLALQSAAIAGQANLEELRTNLNATSLIHHRLQAIGKLRAHHVRINLQTLQRLTTAKVAAWRGLDWPARGASIAMMLGILGTFVGLALTVQQIQFALPEGDELAFESLKDSVADVAAVMGGIKTAFSTSLVGMAIATLLTLMQHRVRDQQSEFFEDLERFTTEDLLPAAVPAYDDESLLEQVSHQLEVSFDKLESLFTQHRRTLESLNGTEEAFLEIVDQVRSSGRDQDSRDTEDVALGIANASQAIARLADTLPQLVRSVEISQQRFLDRLGPWRQLTTGMAQLWTARLPFGIPGSLVMILLALFSIAWATMVFRGGS